MIPYKKDYTDKWTKVHLWGSAGLVVGISAIMWVFGTVNTLIAALISFGLGVLLEAVSEWYCHSKEWNVWAILDIFTQHLDVRGLSWKDIIYDAVGVLLGAIAVYWLKGLLGL